MIDERSLRVVEAARVLLLWYLWAGSPCKRASAAASTSAATLCPRARCPHASAYLTQTPAHLRPQHTHTHTHTHTQKHPKTDTPPHKHTWVVPFSSQKTLPDA